MKKTLAFLLLLTMILSLFGLTTFAKGYEYPPNVRISVHAYRPESRFTPEDFPDVEIIAIEEDDVPGFFLFTLSAREEEALNNRNNAIDRLKKHSGIDYAEAEKELCNATIDDNFPEDTIIVSIQGKYNQEKEIFTVEDFPEIECTDVREIFFSASNWARKLCLTISPAGKQNVLDAIKKLESNPKVQRAHPNYFIEWPEEPDYDCEHEWQDATCIAPKTCRICGAMEGEKDPDQHMVALIPEGTCQDDICSKCGAIMRKGTPDEREAHWFDHTGTCHHCGKTEFELFGNHICSVFDGAGNCIICHREGTLQSVEEEIAYTYCETFGHTPGAEATKTEAQTCTVCGVVLKEATGKGNPHTAAGDLFGATAMLSLAAAAAVLLKKKR